MHVYLGHHNQAIFLFSCDEPLNTSYHSNHIQMQRRRRRPGASAPVLPHSSPACHFHLRYKMAERSNKRERQEKSHPGAAASPVAPHTPPGRGCPLLAGPLLPAPAETPLRRNPRWAAAHLRCGPSAGGRDTLAPCWPLRHLPRCLADPSPPQQSPGPECSQRVPTRPAPPLTWRQAPLRESGRREPQRCRPFCWRASGAGWGPCCRPVPPGGGPHHASRCCSAGGERRRPRQHPRRRGAAQHCARARRGKARGAPARSEAPLPPAARHLTEGPSPPARRRWQLPARPPAGAGQGSARRVASSRATGTGTGTGTRTRRAPTASPIGWPALPAPPPARGKEPEAGLKGQRPCATVVAGGGVGGAERGACLPACECLQAARWPLGACGCTRIMRGLHTRSSKQAHVHV